ncbi:tRNA (N6-threonylcarbamoyladenosine(37)-N6)-methyltransferase TrmO [Draconibacterium sp. IB214405]|uniref:tRNA (N6-threonylcarbamoyladenosine(37)-N6)-methyltransferase TrmO n=1 Tax=Draconibacterium sp. IB214405 TaxID=3097352 RepID=UPI002A0EBC4D|nr:tRNA (N6-threonylcarbamoyladenosine(37)-N6)-methyltransferase TrmO [Draconibacterium sp. IB214405]MDX8339609.1 tRNA (N6-threonylcarbamoyladenosine(37)-N6)-methyltransferase TrmO [Draconibacterium sp. IB214405]
MTDFKKVEMSVIGTISTPHKTLSNIPIQSVGAEEFIGIIELEPHLTDALDGLEGFSNLILLYHLHLSKGYKTRVTPFMDDKEHGLFATRSPKRPSPIGMSTVELLKIEGNKIWFKGADMLDGTPLIDIKPFFRQVDNRPNAVSGWLDAKDDDLPTKHRSDDRFV